MLVKLLKFLGLFGIGDGATYGNTGFATSTSIFRGSKGNTKMASLHTTYENPDFVTPTSINVFIV